MKKKIIELEKSTIKYNEDYRKGESGITDAEFDTLLEELKSLDPINPLLNKVGYIASNDDRKEVLPEKMFSLDKLKTLDAVLVWIKKYDLQSSNFVLTPKLDGISLLVKEGKGQCWTRGDGFEGQRSDNYYSNMVNLPFKKDDVTTSGEAIIFKEDFKSMKEYKNARNASAGLFNTSIPTEKLEYVNYIRYNLFNNKFKTKVETLKFLNIYNVVKLPFMRIENSSELNEDLINELYEKWGKDLAIDGIVIDVDDIQKQIELGRENNNNPKYAKAIKFGHWQAKNEVKITGHKFSISKQGYLKGTVQFDPINVNGVEIKQATFYNASFLFEWGLCVGRTIEIKRSGDVIPKIVGVEGISIPEEHDFKNNKEYKKAYDEANIEAFNIFKDDNEAEIMADNLVECPSCGSLLKWDENLVELVCENKFCKDRVISELTSAFQILGVEDFGEPSVEKLYNAGLQDLFDILSVDESVLDQIEGFGKISSKKLLKQFDKLKTEGVTLDKLMHASNLYKGLGSKTLKLMNDTMPLSGIRTVEELCQIDGVSEITANSYIKGNELFFDFYEVLVELITIKEEVKKVPVGVKYSGLKVCFSGFRNKDLEQTVISNGGEIVSGISKHTTHLIIKDLNKRSSKIIKAEKLGILVLSLDEFLIILKKF